MKPTINRVILRSGLGSMVAGAVLLFAPGANLAQAHGTTKQAPVAAPNCHNQHNLNNPTNTSHEALDSYWFAVDHNGHTTAFCTLFGNVDAGDVVTAHVTMDASAPAGTEVTLLSNISPAATPKNQTLFDCASFGDTSGTGDTCLSATSAALTVNVPNCGFQIDLIYGEPISPVVEGTYAQQDRWIDGMVAKASTTCGGTGGTTATPTPAPGGVQGVTAPGTGADLFGNGPMAALLLVLGAGAVAVTARRRKGDIP